MQPVNKANTSNLESFARQPATTEMTMMTRLFADGVSMDEIRRRVRQVKQAKYRNLPKVNFQSLADRPTSPNSTTNAASPTSPTSTTSDERDSSPIK